jgi:hypothetical protein
LPRLPQQLAVLNRNVLHKLPESKLTWLSPDIKTIAFEGFQKTMAHTGYSEKNSDCGHDYFGVDIAPERFAALP